MSFFSQPSKRDFFIQIRALVPSWLEGPGISQLKLKDQNSFLFPPTIRYNPAILSKGIWYFS
jgi:hypothetical protein